MLRNYFTLYRLRNTLLCGEEINPFSKNCTQSASAVDS